MYKNPKKDYSECHFPFLHNGFLYNDCISSPQGSRICATTYNFDLERKWKYCPSNIRLYKCLNFHSLIF